MIELNKSAAPSAPPLPTPPVDGWGGVTWQGIYTRVLCTGKPAFESMPDYVSVQFGSNALSAGACLTPDDARLVAAMLIQAAGKADGKMVRDDLARAVKSLHAECMTLRYAIRTTLDNNAHLADGENCTLLPLKEALRDIGDPWGGDDPELADGDDLSLFDAGEARAINSERQP